MFCKTSLTAVFQKYSLWSQIMVDSEMYHLAPPLRKDLLPESSWPSVHLGAAVAAENNLVQVRTLPRVLMFMTDLREGNKAHPFRLRLDNSEGLF